MAAETAYLGMLQNLLPKGRAWTRDPESNLTMVLSWLANELALLDAAAQQLIQESDPAQTVEMLSDWQAEVGLPNLCNTVDGTLQEQRQAVVNLVTMQGGQSQAFFESVAEALGYTITITTYHPFICGLSHCDDTLWGGHANRYVWTVDVPGPRLTYFRCGESRCGEQLLAVQRAQDLECLLQQLAPAHTLLVFDYTGV